LAFIFHLQAMSRLSKNQAGCRKRHRYWQRILFGLSLLVDVITEQEPALIINTLKSPTGKVFSREEPETIAEPATSGIHRDLR
jgi:hypothetical protein